MTGLTKNAQVAILDNTTVGLERTLYLRLLVGTTAGDEPNDDGTLPSGMSEVLSGVPGSGYSRHSCAGNATPGSGDWSAATAGALGTATSKQLPKSGGAAIAWTASGANFGDLCAWVLTTDTSNTYTAANAVLSGPIVDGSGNPVKVTINDGSTFQFDSSNPIVARLGDPAKVTNSAAGSQRTVPT